MTIKELVLKINDVLCYIIFAIICITAAIVGMTSGVILWSWLWNWWVNPV